MARELSDVHLVALCCDAIYLPVRPSGAKEGVLCAWGVSQDGQRVLLAVMLGMRESEEDWLPGGVVGSAGGAWAARRCRLAGFLPPPHRTVHAIFPHTALRRSSPSAFGFPVPRPVGARRDDGSVEVDQAEAIGGLVCDDQPPVARRAFVAFGHEAGEPDDRVKRDLVEGAGRVPVAEVARPAAQEAVDLLHDGLDRDQQPAAVREFTEPVAGVLDCLS